MKITAISATPLSMVGSIVSSEGDELRFTGGKVQARRSERFVEFNVPSANLVVRGTWKPKGPKSRKGDDALALALSINGSRPIDVVARDGALYARRGDRTDSEPYVDERLRELGRVLAAVKQTNALDLSTIEPPSVGKPEVGVAFGLFGWAGCVSDFAGAGAGIGGAAGVVVGSGAGGPPGTIAGATGGAVAGGAIGGAVGLGACTTVAILEWLFD